MRPRSFPALVAFLLTGAVGVQAQDVKPAGGATRLELGGRLHTQYALSSVEGEESDIVLRRAWLTLDGALTPRVDGRIQVDVAGDGASLTDGWIRVALSSAFRVSIGQFKRPFDIFWLASNADLSLIERDGRVAGVDTCTGVGRVCSFSRLTEELQFSDRDRGVRFDGRTGRVSWRASVTNGTGANARDENDARSFGGRLSVGLTDRLTVSGQMGIHDYLGPDEETARAAAWSADLQHGTWRDGFLLQAALAGGENWKALDPTGEPAAFLAAQVVASVYLPVGGADDLVAGVEPLARVSLADPDTDLGNDAGVVLTPGLMLYLAGRNKIGANLDVYSPQRGDAEYSLKLQSFLYF